MISVIIPFYNYKNVERFMVWRYLLNQQNLNDLEIIVINDDSEKEYVKILKEETAELKNIKIINLPKHKGFSAALNKGIACANGELLAFWKPSDIFTADTLKKLEDAICGFDLAVCSIGFLNTDVTVPEEINAMSYTKNKNCENVILTLLNQNLFSPLGNKLYRKEIIAKNNLAFDELASEWNADELFNLEYFACAKSVNVISDPLYTIATVPLADFMLFDEKRLLTEHKTWLGYLKLISCLKLGTKTQSLAETLYLNKIYLAIANFERAPWQIEDKLQFLQTIFNDELINSIIAKKEEEFSFCYYFTEYLILTILDGEFGTHYVQDFQYALESMIYDTHAELINNDNLLAALHKTRKMNAKDNFLVPIVQADIYLSLLYSNARSGKSVPEYFNICKEKCLEAINHTDNKYAYGKHIYDAVSLNLAEGM